MISVCIQLGFENQSDTVILLCKCLRQDISRRWITKEDKESEVWQYNLGCCMITFTWDNVFSFSL
ncbi:unnamed protein product, partial [Brassica oleracea var. botrytis]